MARRHIGRWITTAVLTYAGICAAMFVLQRSLQYHPDPSPMDPAAAGLATTTAETLDTADGERIVVWWQPPRDAVAPVYLYLHGNGANLMARAARLQRLAQAGAGFLAVSWRGYGGSSGAPHERGLMHDARAGYALLAQRADPARIVFFGESLGTTVALMLAAEQPPAALVLDSSFLSALDVAQGAYPLLPVRWLMRDPFRADLAAPDLRVPVLQVHCRDDPVTPIASARQLNALLAQPRPLHVVDARCHTPSLPLFEAELRAFVDVVVAREAGLQLP
jgi:pimeloyl-ACP methyl ester carboxylesterase